MKKLILLGLLLLPGVASAELVSLGCSASEQSINGGAPPAAMPVTVDDRSVACGNVAKVACDNGGKLVITEDINEVMYLIKCDGRFRTAAPAPQGQRQKAPNHRGV
jgi:hypothetical protein